MKRLFSYFTFLCLCVSYNASSQTFSWSQGFTTTGGIPVSSASINASAFDVHKNIYSIGNFTGTIDLDQGTNVYNIASMQPGDLFLTKEDNAGNFLWAKAFHRKSNINFGIIGRYISIDADNNIYIAGTFSDTVDFDPGTSTYYMMPPISNFAYSNSFLVKLNANGSFVWARQIGGASASVSLQAMNIKGSSVYLFSVSNGVVDVDPGIGVTNLNAGGIIEKLDTAGNFIWAKQIGAGVAGLALDDSSNIYLAGGFQDTVDFDPGPGIAKLYSGSSAGSAVFVAKYDSVANFLWVKQIAVAGNYPGAGGISLDPFGNVFVTGHFGSIADFDPGPGVYNLTSNSTRSIFTLKLRNNGDFAWAKMMGAPAGLFEGRAIATDSMGSVYTASVAPGGCDVDPGTATHYVPGDCVVQKLDSLGNFMWGVGWQGDMPSWIGLDRSNSVYTTGVFSGMNKDFDPGQDTFLLSGSNSASGFILKLAQPTIDNIADQVIMHEGVKVFPNPSTGIITFSASAIIDQIEISDLTGKIVYMSKPGKTQNSIDLSDKASGVYFFIVTIGSNKLRGKLMLQKE